MRTGNLIVGVVLTLVLLVTAGFGLVLDRADQTPEHASGQDEPWDCEGLADYAALIESTTPLDGDGEPVLDEWADALEAVEDDAVPGAAQDYHEALISFLRTHASFIDAGTPTPSVTATPGALLELAGEARALDAAAEEGYARCDDEWPVSMLPRELIEATPSPLEDADWDNWPDVGPSTPETYFI